MPSTEDFVTTQEAAHLLGVSVRSVQLWVENGVLHAWKTAGGHRRIARVSVDDLLAQQREVIETVTGLRVIKLLVIEQNPAYLELYRLKIESFDLPVTVLTARNGYEGLLDAGQQQPHIIVAGLEQDGLDGLEVIRTLEAKLPAAQIIVLTRRTDDEINSGGGLPERVEVFKHLTDFDRLGPLLGEKVRAVRATAR